MKDLEKEKQINADTRNELERTQKELDITKRKIEKVSRVISNTVVLTLIK